MPGDRRVRASEGGQPRRAVLLLGVVVFGLAGCGVSAEASKVSPVEPEGSSTSPPGEAAVVAEGESVRLAARLIGAGEVPGPGDNDGSGDAVVVLEPGRSEVCYDISVEGAGDVTGAHIHAAPEGASGDVVLGLDAPDGGSVSGCATADGMLLGAVAANPGGYYLNVHDEEHPDGAVRGQLAPAPPG